MSADSPDIITQAELRIGTDLREIASQATRICKIYMRELQRHIALGGTIEQGPLTFKMGTISVCHTDP